MKTQTESLKNHLLIATPQMLDPNFAGSVTYICEHNEDGAMGLVLNKPSDYSLREVLSEIRKDTEFGQKMVSNITKTAITILYNEMKP